MEARFRAAGGQIVMSSPEAWFNLRRALANSRNPAVGVDTEGIQMVPPLLVQIAYRDPSTARVVVILEAPHTGRLSQDCTHLLAEPSITKVSLEGRAAPGC